MNQNDLKEAMLYESAGEKVRCILCAHRCVVAEGRLGVCKVRKNIGGKLYSLNYHRVAATHTDPIEKKPLYHFLPGTPSYSVATMGCNFRCGFCQNYTLSMVAGESTIYGEPISPTRLVESALADRARSISYTYSEPTVFFELMSETARLAASANLKNIMVTNGFMTRQALETIAPVLHGANVDLKSFSDDFYKKQCGGRLEPVLDTIRAMKERGIWVEVTTLLIPGLNTDEEEIKQIIDFLVGVDPEIPWHVSRFYPTYRLTDAPPTDPDTILRALELGREMGLRYMYAGNLDTTDGGHTRCPGCDTLLIERQGYYTRIKHLDPTRGRCSECGHTIAGIWQ